MLFPQRRLVVTNTVVASTRSQKRPSSIHSSSWALQSNADMNAEGINAPAKTTTSAPSDPLIKDVSLQLRRLSWFSWWAQIILTTVASVTLLFARNVLLRSSKDMTTMPNFVLASASIALSIGSLFWTWAGRRLSRRLLKKPTTRIQAATMIRKLITTGVIINLLGMLFTILGEQQIVGVLAIKVLTTSRTVGLYDTSTTLLQPLDILVVQATTNTLFSHFSSLVAFLYTTKSVSKLDPPSMEDKQPRRS